jgi:hypothetical protein
LLEVHIRRSYLEMQKWPTAWEKYTTYHRGRPFDFQTLESNWASPMEDEIMPGKLLPQTQHWTAQTIVTLGDRCLAQDWDYQHGEAHQDYQVRLLTEKQMETRGCQDQALLGTEGRHWARRDRGEQQPHLADHNEMVALEQHVVVNNVSSSAVISYISTANKVGGNQWEFHVITMGNISPCWGTKTELIYSLVTTVYVLAASNEIPSK